MMKEILIQVTIQTRNRNINPTKTPNRKDKISEPIIVLNFKNEQYLR